MTRPSPYPKLPLPKATSSARDCDNIAATWAGEIPMRYDVARHIVFLFRGHRITFLDRLIWSQSFVARLKWLFFGKYPTDKADSYDD